MSPIKREIPSFKAQDPLIEVNLGTINESRMTNINGLLSQGERDQLIQLITRYKDCFAWYYHEIPGLFREFVEHCLPIKEGFKAFKQPSKRFNLELMPKIKQEIERLLKVGFIRTTRYVQWLSNIGLVIKMNGKVKICIDFCNLNFATPNDEYVMPIADMLVDVTANNEILSFMNGYSRYN